MKLTDRKWMLGYKDYHPVLIRDDGALVAKMITRDEAHLAAAAPEMYRALEMCANGLNTAELLNGDDLLNIQIDRETYRSINEALTKARGEA